MWPATWIDERGSEVLEAPECRRLLALGAKEGCHGHVAVSDHDLPTVLPVDYGVDRGDVILVVGEGLYRRLAGRLVAFQVDGAVTTGRGLTSKRELWSVMVQGLATGINDSDANAQLPHPHVPRPGRRVVRIRAEILSGRRIPDVPAGAPPGGGDHVPAGPAVP